MEAIGSAVLIAIALVCVLSYAVMGHSLSVIARKTDQGDIAEVFAWLPGLQLLPMIWAGGGSVLRFIVFSLAWLLASGLLGLAARGMNPELAALLQLFSAVAFFVVFGLYVSLLTWRTAAARNLPGWIGLMVWVPGVSFFLYPVLAFHDGWAPPHKLGTTLGLLCCGLLTLPLVVLSTRMDELVAAAELQEWTESEAFADVGSLDAMPTETVATDPGAPGGAPAAMPTPVAEDHEKSIRALFELKGRFEVLDSLTVAENMSNPDHRTRALSLVRGIRADLEGLRSDLDEQTYQELATHLVRVEGTVEDFGRPASQRRGSFTLAAGSATTSASGGGGPAAPAPSPADAAPIRPFPVHASNDCPRGTELRTRESDEGEEEWCQQLPQYGGLRHGGYVRYREGGRPEQVGQYSDGLRVGVWTRFHPTGEVRAQAEFAEGLQHGWLLTFDQDGQRQKALRFDRGSVVR